MTDESRADRTGSEDEADVPEESGAPSDATPDGAAGAAAVDETPDAVEAEDEASRPAPGADDADADAARTEDDSSSEAAESGGSETAGDDRAGTRGRERATDDADVGDEAAHEGDAGESEREADEEGDERANEAADEQGREGADEHADDAGDDEGPAGEEAAGPDEGTEADEDTVAVAKPVSASRRRRRRTHWARGLAGAALSVVAAGAVAGATIVPWPSLGGDAASVVISPDAAASVVACDGPILAVGRDSAKADEITVAARTSVTVGASDDAEPANEKLKAKGVSGKADAQRYEVEPDGAVPVSLSAATSADVREDDMAGFSASACRPASMESWIVGGSAAVGATDVLLIANPGRVNATVELTVFGTQGATPAPGDPIAIPAGSQIALPLAGIAGGEETPLVRVTASGAPVRASLQSSQVQTLDPVGIDSQEAVTASERQVFPGVVVTDDAVKAEATPATVRMLSRETGDATITVTAEGKTRPADTVTVPLKADVPVSADLGGLEPGRYTVAVSSDDALVAAVWQTTGPKGEEDFAWQTPSPELTSDPVMAAVPEGPLAQAYLVNDGEELATVKVTGGKVDEELTLAAGASAHVRLGVDQSYAFSAEGEGASVRAVVAYRDGGSLATLPVWPDAAATADVTVYP